MVDNSIYLNSKKLIEKVFSEESKDINRKYLFSW